MKAFFAIRNHIKIAVTLLILLVTLILTGLLEKQYLRSIDQDFSSIFADRLVPATDIFFMADQLYAQRLHLQSYLLSAEETSILELQKQNKHIDSLLQKYQATYLVDQEAAYLQDLNAKWKVYKTHEEQILSLAQANNKAAALVLFNTEGNTLFKNIITDLQLLSKIQSQVGEDLMDTSKGSISSANSILTIQSGIIILVAILTNLFLLAYRSLHQPGQKFHLN